MMEDMANFDFNKVFEFVLKIAWTILKIPFQMWQRVPEPVKVALGVLIFLLSIFCLYWAIKSKEEWRRKKIC